jgi:hypothetical protein
LKKVLAAVIAAGLIVSGTTAALAASPKPKVAGAGAAEGTAKHEMSESAGTQAKEAKKSGIKKRKKVVVKKKK